MLFSSYLLLLRLEEIFTLIFFQRNVSLQKGKKMKNTYIYTLYINFIFSIKYSTFQKDSFCHCCVHHQLFSKNVCKNFRGWPCATLVPGKQMWNIKINAKSILTTSKSKEWTARLTPKHLFEGEVSGKWANIQIQLTCTCNSYLSVCGTESCEHGLLILLYLVYILGWGRVSQIIQIMSWGF